VFPWLLVGHKKEMCSALTLGVSEVAFDLLEEYW
jgi:hypothetical protein